MKAYDIIIIGAGPGGIFAAYELMKQKSDLKVAVFEAGHMLNKRKCPIDGVKIKSCIHCKSCSIMSGFGGAGAFSDGKLSLSPDVGGNLPEILSILFEKNPSVRIVVTAILLETALQACESLEAFTLKPAEIMQLQVSRSKKAGKGHMLCANNPIFLISAGGCADE